LSEHDLLSITEKLVPLNSSSSTVVYAKRFSMSFLVRLCSVATVAPFYCRSVNMISKDYGTGYAPTHPLYEIWPLVVTTLLTTRHESSLSHCMVAGGDEYDMNSGRTPYELSKCRARIGRCNWLVVEFF